MAQVGKAFLYVQRDGIVNLGADVLLFQVRLDLLRRGTRMTN